MSAIAVRPSRANGWWGMAIFVATEATLFGTLVGTYAYLRFQNAHWPPLHVEKPPVLVPTLLTLALAATSAPLHLASRAVGDGRRALAWRAIAGAFVVQLVYIVWQLHDYVDELHRVDPQHSAYASVLATLLGADHVHVLVGLALSAWLLVRIASRLTRYRVVAVQSIVFYWHAVNVITLVVLAVQLSAHL